MSEETASVLGVVEPYREDLSPAPDAFSRQD